MEIFRLGHGWVRAAIREDQAVDAEVTVVDRVTEVAAIRPVCHPIFIHFGKALVDPVPDEATLQAMIALDGLPVFFQVADAVAHGMSVFAHDEGAGIFGVFGVGDDIGHLGVHRAAQIGGEVAASFPDFQITAADGALVVDDAVGVVAPNEPGHRIMIRTVAALVAQRPDQNAGMVFVTLHHPDAAFYEGVEPFRLVR